MPTQAESSAPSPSHPRPTHSTLQISSQLANLVTKTELAHLRNFIAEQFQLVQATLLSKLDAMDSRLQACEEHLLRSHSHAPDIPTSQPHDPKGKAPLHTSPTFTTPPSHHTPHTSPVQSPSPTHLDPHLSPSHHTPPASPPPALVPDPTASPTSPASSPTQFELVARTSVAPTTSPDSEATHSDPRPTSPAPPSLPTPPSASASLHAVSYQRRKKAAVSK